MQCIHPKSGLIPTEHDYRLFRVFLFRRSAKRIYPYFPFCVYYHIYMCLGCIYFQDLPPLQSLGVGVTSLRPGTECKARALVVVLAIEVRGYHFLFGAFSPEMF